MEECVSREGAAQARMEGVLIEKFVGRLLGNVFFGQKFFPGFLRSGHEWCPKTFYHIIPGEEVFRGISDFRTREESKEIHRKKYKPSFAPSFPQIIVVFISVRG